MLLRHRIKRKKSNQKIAKIKWGGWRRMLYGRKSVEIWESNRIVKVTVSWIIRFRPSKVSSSIFPGYMWHLSRDRHHWCALGTMVKVQGVEARLRMSSRAKENCSTAEKLSVGSRQQTISQRTGVNPAMFWRDLVKLRKHDAPWIVIRQALAILTKAVSVNLFWREDFFWRSCITGMWQAKERRGHKWRTESKAD